MGISPLKFYNTLTENGIRFFTGVPDSTLRNFCLCLEKNVAEQNHIIAANEGNAIAIATGYYLGTGKLPMVYMQNAGFGNAINPLLSLCDPTVYAIPMLVLIGWRGEPGIKDEPQHIKQGEVQIQLLESLGISFDILSKHEQNIDRIIETAINVTLNKRSPFVILVRKGTFDTNEATSTNLVHGEITREESLEMIVNHLPDDSIIVSTTGKTSREIYEIREKNNEPHFKDFLTVGSMGHCSSIALGITIAKPSVRVICIDGDGALIMHMGSIPTIGKVRPKNLIHILINNGVHDSVGGQRTVADIINFRDFVLSNNYRNYEKASTKKELGRVLQKSIQLPGPTFIDVIVKLGTRENLGRPKITPKVMKDLLMNFLHSR